MSQSAVAPGPHVDRRQAPGSPGSSRGRQAGGAEALGAG
jgi:hypothetical protein